MHRNNVHLLHPISYLESIWSEFFGIFLLLLSRLQTAATGQTGVNACILGHLHQRAQCDAAVASLGKWSAPSSSTPASATRIISIKAAGKIKVLVVNNRK